MRPATVSVAVRGAVVRFGATLKRMPLETAVMVIHAASLAAVHVQPMGVSMPTPPSPPSGPKSWLVRVSA